MDINTLRHNFRPSASQSVLVRVQALLRYLGEAPISGRGMPGASVSCWFYNLTCIVSRWLSGWVGSTTADGVTVIPDIMIL